MSQTRNMPSNRLKLEEVQLLSTAPAEPNFAQVVTRQKPMMPSRSLKPETLGAASNESLSAPQQTLTELQRPMIPSRSLKPTKFAQESIEATVPLTPTAPPLPVEPTAPPLPEVDISSSFTSPLELLTTKMLEVLEVTAPTNRPVIEPSSSQTILSQSPNETCDASPVLNYIILPNGQPYYVWM